MARRVQIVRLFKSESRWHFIAHGAAYDRAEAESIKVKHEALGHKVRFLTIGKE